MEKKKGYERVRFPPEVLREAESVLMKVADPNGKTNKTGNFQVSVGSEDWTHDNVEEFFSDYRRSNGDAIFSQSLRGSTPEDFSSLWVYAYGTRVTRVSVRASRREMIEAVFEVFERNVERYRTPIDEQLVEVQPPTKPVVFIGHGRSPVWRDLKDHLQDLHGYQVEAYETGVRGGHTVRDILGEMIAKSAFALLVLTAEDKTEDDQFRARQNVVHETGLFQGALGFSRTVVLLEAGVEEFSNIEGIHQIRFSAGNIRETFGDVLATIAREFPT